MDRKAKKVIDRIMPKHVRKVERAIEQYVLASRSVNSYSKNWPTLDTWEFGPEKHFNETHRWFERTKKELEKFGIDMEDLAEITSEVLFEKED